MKSCHILQSKELTTGCEDFYWTDSMPLSLIRFDYPRQEIDQNYQGLNAYLCIADCPCYFLKSVHFEPSC